jgi:hypothetical protein
MSGRENFQDPFATESTENFKTCFKRTIVKHLRYDDLSMKYDGSQIRSLFSVSSVVDIY